MATARQIEVLTVSVSFLPRASDELQCPNLSKTESSLAFLDPISELYDYLLQREYAGHVEPDDHQMERKAVRSPSLRLRFGRRSDPSLGSDKRVPSTRLRWGKRDNNMPSFYENSYSDEVGEPIHRLIRAPSLRLRFGRSAVPASPNKDEDVS